MREMSNLFKNLFVFIFSIWFIFRFFLTSIFDDEMRKLFLIAVLIFGIIYIGEVYVKDTSNGWIIIK